MPALSSFDYAIVRVVPYVEREEFINVGVILFCRTLRFLGHEVISEFPLPQGGEGPSWAHPVVCAGRLYIRHGDFLYAYDVRARQ